MAPSHVNFVCIMMLMFSAGCYSQEAVTTTTASMPMNGETTTPAAMSNAETTTMACNDEEMAKNQDCCKAFMKINDNDEVEKMVRMVLDKETNSTKNATMWSIDKIVSAEKKECHHTIFKVLAKLTKTTSADMNGTQVDCDMKFRHFDLAKQENQAKPNMTDNIIIDQFCSASQSVYAVMYVLGFGLALSWWFNRF